MRIAINGFGRIGKTFLRTLLLDPKASSQIEIVALNVGPMSSTFIAHSFKYDTIMGTYSGAVSFDGKHLSVDNKKIKIISVAQPHECEWGELHIDWVVDCSGKFTERNLAEQHLQAGAKAVLISAPASQEDVTIIPGVNQQKFDKQQHHIVSLGSCTTNALVPLLKVLYDSCALQAAWVTTTHAYTNSQVLLDRDADNARTSRAAALNIIPASSGAQKSVDKVMPELKGKIEIVALRVPVAMVSLVEVVFQLDKPLTAQDLHKIFLQEAQRAPLQGIIQVCEEPLVSSDFQGNNHSVIIDSLLTHTQRTMGRLFGWYDNEWAYSTRMKDFLVTIAN